MRRHRRLLAATILSALAAASLNACSDSDDVDDVDDRADIDPRTYYDDYQQGESDSLAYGTAPLTASGQAETSDSERADWPGVLEDNTFVDAGTSGFVATDADPLSTFALDVDTGSYSVASELLGSGHRPPAASIRPEEWVNAYDYGYQAPSDADLGVYVDGGAAPSTADGTQLIRVGVKAREIDAADRPPVALTLVADTSGSMDIRDRLGLVKSSVALLAKHLRPTDTVAIVTYGDRAKALLEPTPIGETGTILDAIDQLKPGGSTNMEAGLRQAYDQAREAYRDDAINAVVLASDGVANVGMTGAGGLADMIQKAGADGIHLVTVGYGMGNYNDHLMEQLADQGDGFYAYVDTFDEAQRLFVEDITGTLTVVARDARTRVAFDPELVESYRLIGYDNRAIADDDFTNDDVDAGEIGTGHEATALYEVHLRPGVESGAEIGTVDLRWESTDSGEVEQSTTPIAAADTETEADESLRLAAAVADLAQLLKESTPVADRGVTLDDLAVAAADLDADGVDGAADLVRIIGQAQQAE
ncbi:MAG TPA: von Willebrand factor type A domain-containing protein [Nocardioidaceae bacterium]|nr:von Willebrand factor type A domain-containing protein [Nocardioidaceae bacterium]